MALPREMVSGKRKKTVLTLDLNWEDLGETCGYASVNETRRGFQGLHLCALAAEADDCLFVALIQPEALRRPQQQLPPASLAVVQGIGRGGEEREGTAMILPEVCREELTAGEVDAPGLQTAEV